MTEKYILAKTSGYNVATIIKKDGGWNYKKEFGSTLIENFDITDDKLDGLLLELEGLGYEVVSEPEGRYIKPAEYKFVKDEYSEIVSNNLTFYYLKNLLKSHSHLWKSYFIKQGLIEIYVETKENCKEISNIFKPILPAGILLQINTYEE